MIICDSFVIADWTDPGTHPGRPIAGLHLHRSDDEAWIVLTGRLGFRVGEEEREVPAGESILVTRGTPHSYWNPAPEPARGCRRPLTRDLVWVGACLLALTLGSLAIRTYAIHVHFWIDEGLSVGIASHPLSKIPALLRQDGSPPLYYLLLHVWMSWFG